jgi:hypothetical protein
MTDLLNGPSKEARALDLVKGEAVASMAITSVHSSPSDLGHAIKESVDMTCIGSPVVTGQA